MEKILCVDLNDQKVGYEEKIYVHQNKILHRAFSILLFKDNQVLIQQRAKHKYHCPGLWANTCCSHQRETETLQEACIRGLQEETGIVCELKEVGSFIYYAPFDNGLTEYEIDHVFIGEYDGNFIENKDEVEILKYVDIDELKQDMLEHPEKYTPWFFNVLNIAMNNRKKEK